LLRRLRLRGVQAQLARSADGELEVVRPCATCGERISLTAGPGQPRERCDPCRKERHEAMVSAWRELHPDYQRKYTAAHPEKPVEHSRKYRSEHREELNAQDRRRYAERRHPGTSG